MIMDMPKIGWVERLLADVEVMTMDEVLEVERQQHHLEREIDRGYENWLKNATIPEIH